MRHSQKVDTELARRLRALRRTVSDPERVIAGRAGYQRATLYNALHAGAQHPPPWETTERIVRALGGEPEDYRAAWEAADAGILLTPVTQALTDLDMMHAEHAALLALLRRELIAAGEIPGVPVPEYEFGVDQGRPAAWHAVPGCGLHFPLAAGADFLAGILRHQREAHGDGS